MHADHVPLLALPIETKAEEEAVRKRREKQNRDAMRKYSSETKKAEHKLRKRLEKQQREEQNALRNIQQRDAKRLADRKAQGPPPGAPPGGDWKFQFVREPTTFLLCIPSSKTVEDVVYTDPNKTKWREDGSRV